MKKLLLLLVSGLVTSSCALTGGRVDYDLDKSVKSADDVGQLDIVSFDTQRINFTFKNKAKATAKIIWDESAIVDLSDSSKRIVHGGVKYTQSGEAMPPSIVIAGGTLSDFALPAENVKFIGGAAGWLETTMVPCSSTGSMCDINPYMGKSIVLVLAVEINGKKHEYQAALRLKKKEAEKKT